MHEWKILKDFRHIEWLLQSAKWSNQQKSRENHSIWMKQTIAFPWKEPPSPNTHLQASFAPTPAALLGLVSAAALSWPLPGWLASQESVGDHGWLCLVGLGRWFSEWIYGVCVWCRVHVSTTVSTTCMWFWWPVSFMCTRNVKDFTNCQERENHVHCHTKMYHNCLNKFPNSLSNSLGCCWRFSRLKADSDTRLGGCFQSGFPCSPRPQMIPN